MTNSRVAQFGALVTATTVGHTMLRQLWPRVAACWHAPRGVWVPPLLPARPLCTSAPVSLSPGLSARLTTLLGRYDALQAQLQSADDLAALTPAELARNSRELSQLAHVAELGQQWRALEDEAADLHELLADSDTSTQEGRDMADLAKESLQAASESAAELREALVTALVPTDDADHRAAVVEVRAGTGGDEASLFTGEVLGMYEKYAARQGWSFRVLTLSRPSGVADSYGGVKEASVSVVGDGAFGRLKHESGVHRVQRVPLTESSGRLHTSTMSVVVLPEAEDVDVDIKPGDLQIDTYRASGAGGQHVNTTDSAVRVTHVPTGIVVAIQDERSQHSNKAKALQVLHARVFEAQRRELEASRASNRRSQMGTGDRSERIRTYNFPQDRVTDHRVGLSVFGVEEMLNGSHLDTLTDALEAADKDRRLQELEAADDP